MRIKGALARLGELARASPAELGLLALISALVLGGGAWVVSRASEPPPPAIEQVVAPEAVESPAPPALLVVHVAGHVKEPGIYEVPEGSRVADAIDVAGGALGEADLDLLNLAALLSDGQKVYVPAKGEGVPADPSGQVHGKVNLNTASADQLEELPGVGPVLAQRIVDHREKRGGFTSVRQLMEVSGIGPKTFEALKDLVTV